MLFVRLFKFVVSLTYAANLVFLAIALSGRYINPDQYWIPSLFALFLKIFLAFHLFFTLVFLIGRLYRLVLFSGVVLLFCIPSFISITGFHLFHFNRAGDQQVKLLTYNIDGFNFFHDTIIPNQILKTIHEENPDMMCFQEYFMNREQQHHFIDRLKKMGYVYYYEYITERTLTVGRVGQAIFSKLPFQNVIPIPFDSTTNGAFSVDVPFKGDTIRLFNIHFQSISLQNRETKIPRSMKDFKYPQINYYTMLFKKLMWAFQKRSRQVVKVKHFTGHSPYKVIVCGDFNDTPESFTYRQMTAHLDDSFLKTGFGIGSTFAGRIPLQRIDYILTDPSIRALDTHVVHRPGSDHYAVTGSFEVGE